MAVIQTIPYDQPIANFVPQLDATGHVTHQSFTKKSVTLHHNAGTFTFDQLQKAHAKSHSHHTR